MSRFPDGADGVFTLRIIGNSRTAEQSLRVTPDENGAFTASFELNSHLEGSIYVELLYDGVVLNSHVLRSKITKTSTINTRSSRSAITQPRAKRLNSA